jgi:uncharacterized protein (DUF2141 family)
MSQQFNAIYSVTGTCNNTNVGSIQISAFGGIEPYFYTWVEPLNLTGSFITGLGPGSYNVLINDSAAPENNYLYLNVSVSSGLCLNLITSANTTCGDSNGSIIVSAITDNTDITYTLLDENNNILSQIGNNQSSCQFTNLSAGTYNVLANSLAGCSARTESIIINSGRTLDFDFYIVDDTQCDVNPTGKIFITGLTGSGPFIYEWTNGFTGTSITGLTEGVYGCTVRSSDNCVLTKAASVGFVPSLGLGSWSAETIPTCFNDDGSLILTITGGTGPYYYSASNGTIIISYAQTQTFGGLPEGIFTVDVTDATFCKQTYSTSLEIVNTINNVLINVSDSFCSISGGSIDIQVFGGTPPFIYSLSGITNSENVTTNSYEYSFSNLLVGNYNITVSNIGECVYSQNFTVLAQNKFTHNITTSGTTCGNDNGALYIEISSGGTSPYIYSLSNGFSFQTDEISYTFLNLPSGPYTYQITDIDGCTQQGTTFVLNSQPVNFELYSIPCISGNSGSITALISSGTPPFTFNWSENVSGNPQTIYLTGLTADTYTLLVTDSNNCSYSASTTISCYQIISTYQVYGMSENNFSYISGSKRGMLEMLNEGYVNLISGLGGCLLSATTFTVQTQIQGTTFSNLFYVGSSLIDIPSDQQWYDAVYSLLSPIAQVYTLEEQNSNLTIEIPNNPIDPVFEVNLIIDYVVNCLSTPTPTPTVSLSQTPTNTPTPTVTPSITPSNP